MPEILLPRKRQKSRTQNNGEQENRIRAKQRDFTHTQLPSTHTPVQHTTYNPTTSKHYHSTTTHTPILAHIRLHPLHPPVRHLVDEEKTLYSSFLLCPVYHPPSTILRPDFSRHPSSPPSLEYLETVYHERWSGKIVRSPLGKQKTVTSAPKPTDYTPIEQQQQNRLESSSLVIVHHRLVHCKAVADYSFETRWARISGCVIANLHLEFSNGAAMEALLIREKTI